MRSLSLRAIKTFARLAEVAWGTLSLTSLVRPAVLLSIRKREPQISAEHGSSGAFFCRLDRQINRW